MANYRNAPPKAATLLGSLRGLGYSPATALADIIDNSISARASTVDIIFSWAGEHSVITIVDDGHGMSDAQLDKAMRLGDRSAHEVRDADDLGRFGLGLKTASFSQCRRLTVASKQASHLHTLFWDLDILASCEDGQWRLMEGVPESAESLVHAFSQRAHGTLVVWEKLDRMITAEFTQQDFLDLIDRVERHLAMTFHRFLEGRNPRISIAINGRSIVGWDPFLMSHPATWRSPVDHLATAFGVVDVQCFVLPHKDRMDASEYEAAGGPDGWTGQQGFYVYRNLRMLVAGSWLGLGPGRSWTKEEAHRLARLRLDLPNTVDTDWKIDIRKSSAQPPVEIRARLARLAEDTRSRARKVFAHRGSPQSRQGVTIQQAWAVERLASGLRYKIDESHPAVQMVLDQAGPLKTEIKAMLRIIEETVPVQRIWLDTAESRDLPRTEFSTAPASTVRPVLRTVFRNLVVSKGMSPERAREHLLLTSPFNQHPDLVAALPDDPASAE